MDSLAPGGDTSAVLFTVTVTTQVSIELGGELELSSRDLLHGALDAIDLPAGSDVLVDLRRVTFCDAAGARVLLEFQRTMRRSGHETTFYGAIPIVEKVLRLMVPAPRPTTE
ncbi:MAG: STAS domain-containing protein [Nocardioides sp.]